MFHFIKKIRFALVFSLLILQMQPGYGMQELSSGQASALKLTCAVGVILLLARGGAMALHNWQWSPAAPQAAGQLSGGHRPVKPLIPASQPQLAVPPAEQSIDRAAATRHLRNYAKRGHQVQPDEALELTQFLKQHHLSQIAFDSEHRSQIIEKTAAFLVDRHGADIDHVDKTGKSIVMDAMGSGNKAMISFLLQRNPAAVLKLYGPDDLGRQTTLSGYAQACLSGPFLRDVIGLINQAQTRVEADRQLILRAFTNHTS